MKSQEELTRVVLERSREVKGRRILTCAQGMSLAAEFGVKPVRIGRICNRKNIRISGCQLGCFS